MLLAVATKPDVLTATGFTFVVPGNQRWRPRSVVATVTTAVGGQPNRGYTLTITDGTTTVAQVGNTDAGTEPASGTLTWADTSGASSAAGSTFSSIAPIPDLSIEPGYHIVGAIVNAHAGDTWVSATVWYDFSYTTD